MANLLQMRDALQSEVIEVGNLLQLYYPAALPNMGLPGELLLLPRNSQAAAAAVTEFTVTCQPCQAEMQAMGRADLGSGASDFLEIVSTRPVRTAEDRRGMRLRSGEAQWGRFA